MLNWFRQHKARRLSALLATGLGLIALLSGGSRIANAATSSNVGVFVHIINPPNAITDLAAAPVGSSQGDVQLSWTAPSNDNNIPISHYFIRYATFPAPSAAQAETWWTNQAATNIQFSPAMNPGVQEFTTVPGLTVNVTYYFGIKSVDNDGSLSPIDTRTGNSNQAASQPVNISSPPATPSNFAGAAVSTTSIQWTWSIVSDAGFYALYDFPSDAYITQTTGLSITETSLSVNTAYSRRLRAGNGFGQSNPTLVQTVYTLANPPTTLVVDSIGFTNIIISWNANSNPANTTYRVERSLDNLNFLAVTNITDTTYDDTGLSEETTYYYRLRAINGDGIQTTVSNTVSAYTPKQVDFVSPRMPMGLHGSVDSGHRAFTLIWEAVEYNSDGTSTSDIAGYNIYRRNTLTGASTKLNSTLITVTAFADQVDGQTYYYTVTAMDTSGNESEQSMYADSSINANIIFVGADGISNVVMPSSVNDLLRSAHNKYGVPLNVILTEQPLPSDDAIIRHIEYALVNGVTSEKISDLAFAEPQSIVAVGYPLVNGQLGRGNPAAAEEGKIGSRATKPTDLSLYWNNGVTWIKIGGTVDISAQAVKTKSSFLGNYQLRVAPSATSLTLEQSNVYPRVFTPNGDGLNDRVYFVLENPNTVDVQGEILDTAGRHVAILPPPSTVSGIGTTLVWDGKDKNGSVVPSGAYIYRIKGEGKTFTGTVAVAR